MAENLASGVISIGVDASGVTSGIADVKNATKQLDASTGKLDATTRRFVSSLERQANQAGKTRSEYAAFRAEQLGVSAAVDPLIQKLKAAEQGTTSYGVSTKQTAAALRQLPAQISDIVVSLQGGQRPLTILLQQGSQIKDSFGGVGETFRALTGLINPAIAAFAAVSGVIGTVAFGFSAGSKETSEFNKALILTGNYAGTTAAGLADMARRISSVAGTQGQAAAALTELTSSGRFSAAAIEDIGRAAVAMNVATGRAVRETVEEFKSLETDPVKSVTKLNDQYHFLTAAVYQQIKALDDQGRAEDATIAAQKAFANALESRAASVVQSLGTIERAWKKIVGAAKAGWDAILNIGREDTLDIQIQKAVKQVEFLQKKFDTRPSNTTGPALEAAKLRLSLLQDEKQEMERLVNLSDGRAKSEETAIKRLQAEDEFIRRYGTHQERVNDVIKKQEGLLGRVLTAQEKLQVEEAVGRKPKAPKKEREFRDDAATKLLQDLRNQQAALEEQLETGEKLTGAAKKRAEFEQLITDLRSKKVLTEDQKSLLSSEAPIKAQLEKNAALEREAAIREVIAKAQEREDKRQIEAQQRVQDLKRRLGSAQEGRDEQYQREIEAAGLGDRDRKELQSQRAIFREFRAAQEQFAQSNRDILGSDSYREGVDAINEALNEALKAQQDYYQAVRDLEADPALGFSRAAANFIEESTNMAKQSERVFTKMFESIGDGMAQFVLTGKASFGDLFRSIAADIVKLYTNRLVAQFLLGLGGSGGTDIVAAGIIPATAGALANGGPASAGSAYRVGEHGPELFVPRTAGTVVPNGHYGGGPSITQNISIGSGADRAMILEAIDAGNRRTKAELASQYKRGQGVFA